MGDIQEIKQLMEQLAKSEKDKELASKKMQEVLEKIYIRNQKYIARNKKIYWNGKYKT